MLKGSMTRKYNIHMLKYIIHMCTKSCLQQALTRAFCAMRIRGYEVLSSTGADSRTLRFDTEGQPEFQALRRGSRPTSSQTKTSSLSRMLVQPSSHAAERSSRRILKIIRTLHQEATYELPDGNITTDGAESHW